MPAQEASIAVGGRNMVYITFGNGKKPFVILAGMSMAGIRGLGEAVAAAYDVFTRDYTVWLFDRADVLPEGYDTFALAEDIAGAMTHLGIRDADVLGVSQGGMMAQLLAARHPELVRSMVLCSTACRIGDEARETLQLWLDAAERRDIPGINRSFYERVYPEQFCRDNAAAIESALNVGTMDQCRRFAVLARAALSFDSRVLLGDIHCPVLVIGDDTDAVLTGEASRELARLLGCELYMYSGYGHAVYDLSPDIKQRMLTFFEVGKSD